MSGRSPLSELENEASRRLNYDGTPVGDTDNSPKIQLCLELRKKEIKTTRKSAIPKYELVLEVSVMYLKNLPRRLQGVSGGKSQTSKFVKLRLSPNDMVHTTDLKNQDKVNMDFVEVFGIPLNDEEDLKGRTLEVLICDKKNTRNANVLGHTQINVDKLENGKPICQWFKLSTEQPHEEIENKKSD